MIIPSMVQGDFDRTTPSRDAMAPSIPDALTAGTLDALMADGEVEVTGLECAGETAIHSSFQELEVEGARFSHCCFAASDLSRSIFRDVIFEDCDLSNVVMDQVGFTRCSFVGCKLTGASFAEASFEDVTFKHCPLSFSAFTGSRWRHVSVLGCDFTGADMAEVNQRFVRVSECRFIETNFFRTALAGMDFTTSVLENVSFSDSMTEFYGTKLSVYQAASLARLLGVIVEE